MRWGRERGRELQLLLRRNAEPGHIVKRDFFRAVLRGHHLFQRNLSQRLMASNA